MRARRLLPPIALMLALAACAGPTTPPDLPAAPASPGAGATPGASPAAGTGMAVTPAPAAPTSRPAADTTAPPAAASPTPDPHGLRLLAMGASDVVGLGADDPPTQGWAPVLAGLLGPRATRPIALTKVGALGRTAADMVKFDLEKAVAARPEIAVLWTGANDVRTAVKLEDFRVDLDAILDGLEGTHARLFVLNLPDLDRLPFFAEHREAYAAVMPAWQAAIREEGAAHGAVVVDLAAYTTELETHPDYLWFDGFHPSTRGYARLAAILADAVGPAAAAAR